MRFFVMGLLASGFLLATTVQAEDAPKKASKIVLRSPDGKKTYDLGKLTADGPILVRLTCACSGCDQELPFFQTLQAAYDTKGLKTLAVFREKPEAMESYAVKKNIRFLWLEDPKGDFWKTFDAKTMPTNLLFAKGGALVKVVAGCTRDGKNAQVLSAEIAKLLKTKVAPIASAKAEPKK